MHQGRQRMIMGRYWAGRKHSLYLNGAQVKKITCSIFGQLTIFYIWLILVSLMPVRVEGRFPDRGS